MKTAPELLSNRNTMVFPQQHRRCFTGALLAIVCMIALPAEAKVSISVKDGIRTIESDGMPDHPTGEFPNENNPNTISAQTHKYKMPAEPSPAETTSALGMWPFGVAINGIPFDPFAAEWWRRNPRSGWQYEPMFAKLLGIDDNNAHVQPDGSYHYHGIPTYLVKEHGAKTKPALVGYAADGYPIYGPYGYAEATNPKSAITKLKSSYRLKSGERTGGPGGNYDGHFVQDFEYVPGLGDLDECNGRTGVTPEYPSGTYYYVLTDAYPFIPRIFHGKPDSSFLRQPPPFGRRGPGGGGPGGRPGQGPLADSSRPGTGNGPPPRSGDMQGMGFLPPPQGADNEDRPQLADGMRPTHPPMGMEAPEMGRSQDSGTQGQRPSRSSRRGPLNNAHSLDLQGAQDAENQSDRLMPPRPGMRYDRKQRSGNAEDEEQGPPPGMRPPPPDAMQGGQPADDSDRQILGSLFGSDEKGNPPPPHRRTGRKGTKPAGDQPPPQE